MGDRDARRAWDHVDKVIDSVLEDLAVFQGLLLREGEALDHFDRAAIASCVRDKQAFERQVPIRNEARREMLKAAWRQLAPDAPQPVEILSLIAGLAARHEGRRAHLQNGLAAIDTRMRRLRDLQSRNAKLAAQGAGWIRTYFDELAAQQSGR